MTPLLKNAKPAAPLAGYWHAVLFSPEPAVGERITVGVALRLADGSARFRWLRSFERLRRIFGEDAAKHLPFLMRHAEALIARGDSNDSEFLHFGDVRELWTEDADTALDELFLRFVPLARDFEVHPRTTTAVQNRRLRDAVYERLKVSENPAAASLIPQNSLLRSTEDPARFLDVPLQGRQRFGTMVSAHARKLDTIDRNVYPAVAQLNAAARIHKIDNVAVFLLRPDEKDFTEEEYDEIDEHIHQLVYVLQNEGVPVFPEISTDLMAQSVAEWGLRH